MQLLKNKLAGRVAAVGMAIGLTTVSMGCSVSGGSIGGSGGIGTNGQPTFTIGGTITFKSNFQSNEMVDTDTGQSYTDDGSVDYSGVHAVEGETSGGSVFEYDGGGGGGGGDDGCGGGNYFCMEEVNQY
jgi:hypothetical protein